MHSQSVVDETIQQYSLNKDQIPQHVAIIMDGNGRWAKAQNKPRKDGHIAGRFALKKAVQNCAQLGIKYLTAYAFSTENWSRPKTETQFLMSFFKSVIEEEIQELNKENVKLRFLGDINGLPKGVQDKISRGEEQTQNNI